MTRALFAAALLAATALSLPARAEDPRLVERLYSADEVVRIEGRANVQATIRFAEDEHIENVAIGDSTAWQVTPNRRANLLFIKPLADRAATNMTVVTDRHTYLFDLVASPAHRTPLYVLAFTYPDEPEDEQLADGEAAGAPEGPNAVELAAATDPYAVVDPAELNHAWESKGTPALFPSQVYDDGEATFLTWAPGATLPAILVKDHEGTEGPVNFAVRGEVIVVDGVPREIVLRAGRENATLSNRGPVREPRRPALAQAAGQANPTATEVK
jgi:type IV secretion system protein VirB9